MKNLTILVPQIKPPHVKDTVITQLQNIFHHIEEKYNLKIIWIIFQENQFNRISDNNKEIIDFHKYKNAVEILEEFKPDLVMLEVRLSLNSIIFKKAAEYKQVPIITISPTGRSERFGKFFSIKSMRNLIFLDKVAATTETNEKRKFAMLSYSFKRYFFLLNTLKSTGYNFLNLVQFIMFYPRIHIFSECYPALNRITEGNLNICFNQHWSKRLKKEGFEPNKILLAGDPVFDNLFIKLSSIKKIIQKSEKTNVLLCPTPMYELGWMTKKEQEKLILKIIHTITKRQDFELSIKIHPSSTSLSDYESILQKTENKVNLFQKEDTIDLINQNDVIIIYGSSTVILDTILVKKPLILLHTSNEKFNRLFDPNIMKECTKLEQLNSVIDMSRNMKINENDYNDFVRNQIGKFDGQNAIQIANNIFKMLENLGK